MPLAYYSRAATAQFWSEHWGGHSVEELLRVAQTSPLTSLLEQHLPRQGSILAEILAVRAGRDRKSTRLNSSHYQPSRMPSSA